MTMQIHVDPAGLTQEQREAVAGFILAYPGAAQAAVAEIPAFIHKDTADVDLVELGKLQHDHESTLPAAAFTAVIVHDDPAVAFGAPLAPVATLTQPSAPTPAGSAPPPPAAIAQPPVNLGPVSSGAPATPGGVDFSAALAADAQKLAAFGQSGAAVLPNGVELDAKGFPWDARIHAESRAKVADGSWRMKRNLDPIVRTAVEYELRQVMGAPVPSTTSGRDTPVFGDANTSSSAVLPVVSTPAIIPGIGAVNVPPAAPPPADARAQFVGLVGRASAAIQAQKVTQAEVNQCCVDAGVPALPLLANRLDLVATVAANVDALIALRK